MTKVLVFPVTGRYDWMDGACYPYSHFVMDHYLADISIDVVQPAFLTIFTPLSIEPFRGRNEKLKDAPICVFQEKPLVASLLLHFTLSGVKVEPGFNCIELKDTLGSPKTRFFQPVALHLDKALFPGVNEDSVDIFGPYVEKFVLGSDSALPYKNHLCSLMIVSVPGYSGKVMSIAECLRSEHAEVNDAFRYLLYGRLSY